MDCLLARDNDSTNLSSWTKLTLLLPHQDNVDAFFLGGGAEGGVSKDSSFIQMKFVSWTPSFPGIFLRVLPCLAPLWSKSPMNIQSENWAGRSDLRRKCIAFVLPNWESFSWPNCSSLKSRVSFVRNSSQFGRSDVFCLKTARSGRPVVTNGERPWIGTRLTNLSTIEGTDTPAILKSIVSKDVLWDTKVENSYGSGDQIWFGFKFFKTDLKSLYFLCLSLIIILNKWSEKSNRLNLLSTLTNWYAFDRWVSHNVFSGYHLRWLPYR